MQHPPHLWRAVRIAALATVLVSAITHPARAQEDDELQIDQNQAERLRQTLAAPAPQGTSPEQLAKLFLERIRAARLLSQSERELAEINAGLLAVGADSRAAYGLLNRLAEYNGDRGDLVASLRAREQALKVAASPGLELNELTLIAGLQTVLRNRTAANDALAKAQQVMQRLRGTANWSRLGDLWQAKLGAATAKFQRQYGSLDEAEAASRACIASARSHLGKVPDSGEAGFFVLVDCTRELVETLLKSGRLDDAAIFAVELRELARDYAERQGRSAFAARLSPAIVHVAIERGRFDEAKSTIDVATERLRKSGAGEGSLHLAQLRLLSGTIEVIKGNWQRADEMFSARRAGMLAHRDQGQRVGVLLPEWAYALQQLGQKDKALDMMNRIVVARTERFGEDVLATWEARGFRALALAASGQREVALREFAAAVPRIIELGHGERASAESGLLRSTRLNWIFEGYLSLLAELAAKGERLANLDPMDEAFRLADLVRGSTVQRALSIAASRAVISNRELADLARRYHNQERDLAALSDGLGNLLARGRVASMDNVVSRIRADLESLRLEQARVQRTIEQRFPAYASLIDPQPPTIAEVQAVLRPGETLISVLTGSGQSYVWGIPKSGPGRFAAVPVNAAQVARSVNRLRRTLDPTGVTTTAQVRAFEFETSHALFKQFVAPIESALQGARSLIVVPHGELSQLPFSVLTTAPFSSTASAPRFDGYADAPWLVKRLAISQLPSTTALLALRRGSSDGRAERPFVGFGDPVFSTVAATAAAAATSQRGFATRNPPLAASKAIDEGAGPSSSLHLLEPLPETATEVHEVAQVLGADEQRDVFLRERASERNVKAAELARYRVVMFATHGLLPGNLPGLSQPALALTHPSLAGAGEDGLLMLDEILGLKLHADWVVLSACNTASPDAISAEAVSGLGRAFFFAGARALLVTSWPIETQSARVLTTTLFRSYATQADRPAAQTLQEASLALMQKRSSDSRQAVSYSHPMFWAPFILVGDGD